MSVNLNFRRHLKWTLTLEKSILLQLKRPLKILRENSNMPRMMLPEELNFSTQKPKGETTITLSLMTLSSNSLSMSPASHKYDQSSKINLFFFIIYEQSISKLILIFIINYNILGKFGEKR